VESLRGYRRRTSIRHHRRSGFRQDTLVDALQREGFACSIEAGRAIIQHQQAMDGPALRDPVLFAELMLSWEVRSHEMARHLPGPVFFDRGVPDVAGYLRLMKLPVPAHVEQAAALFRYNRRVFVAPPWAEIFAPDAERKQTFDEATRTYEAMVTAYTGFGYDLIELPRCGIAERVAFLRAKVHD
jgi:predicted ATPase